MTTGIYHWKLGDVALARLCKKIYARVQVVKDEKRLFYDDKVLGISANEDGSLTVTKELCYYVETHHTKNRFWLPYTSMHLAERSRPFYGPADRSPKSSQDKKKESTSVPRKRKIKEDHILPVNVKLSKREPDFNVTYDIRHLPLKQGKYGNAFEEFIRRGRENIFDQYYKELQNDFVKNKDALDYLINVDASTENKFELVINNIVSEKEIDNYLHQCWKYNFVHKHSSLENKNDGTDCSNSTPPVKAAVRVHISWCLVCAKAEKLRECPNCPASFHLSCRKEWLTSIIHRKNPPKKQTKSMSLVKKILSGTRIICSVHKEKEDIELCPSCMWGPKIGYDDVVWHKLAHLSWWPARVLTPGSIPSCLLTTSHSPHDWPLKYYGTLNHSWACTSRMCLFLPKHVSVPAAAKDSALEEALLDACDDYIAVYLT